MTTCKTGAEHIKSLKDGRTVYIDGKLVDDVTEHPAFRNAVKSAAMLYDFQAKPDLVAPGVGIESIAEAGSTLWNTKPAMRLRGTVSTVAEPYLSLSGTSMASPVVSGTIALMLEANPALTPNLVKAILQYTAEHKTRYNEMTQGAGFLNARGAVQMAKSLAASTPGAEAPSISDPTP